MHKMQIVMWVCLAITIALPVYMWRRSTNIFASFERLVAQQGYRVRKASPVSAFSGQNPPEGFHHYLSYDGALGSGTPFSLILVRRTESVSIRGVQMPNSTIYVGAYLPPSVKLDDAWQKDWQERAKKGKADVCYAAPAAEGGVVIFWKGPPEQKTIERHLEDLDRSLPRSAAG